MQIGMNLPVMVPGMTRDDMLAWSRGIDAGPFSSLAAGERICFPNPDQMVLLSAAAAVTERVRICTTVVVLPMHETAPLAKRLATLDVLSEGRLSVGVGAGARVEDYAAHGRTPAPRPLARMQEQVEEMRRVWRGEPCVPGALRPVEPAPLQRAGPEVLVGALSEASIRRAARYADGITGHSFGPDPAAIAAACETALEAWKAAERDAPPRLVTAFWYALGPGGRAQLDAYLERYLAFMGEGAARALAPTVRIDSEPALRAALAACRDTGVDEVLLIPTTRELSDLERVADLLG